MNEEILKPKKKFKGFTAIFQNQHKKNVKKEVAKKPFTGFSEFYKKIKDCEIYDEDDDYDSLFDAYLPRKEIPKNAEKKEEPPLPPDKHFKPKKYFEWCKERSKEAFDKCAEEEGDTAHKVENAENERAGSVKANSLVMDMKKYACYRKYDEYRKSYDQSTLDGLSQMTDDINPWFRKMFNRRQNVINHMDENRVQIEMPEVDDGLRNIFEKLNARETLKFNDELPRKVNTYPYEFQFKFLNRRMKNILQRTTHAENLNDFRPDSSSINGSEKPNPWNFEDELPYQKKELEIYFNTLTKPKRDINFQPEDFKTWYTKMSFNYDRRFKDFDKMNITPEQEDFSTWVAKNTEKMNKKYNEEFSKTMADLKHWHLSKHNRQKDVTRDHLKQDFPSDLSKCNWSTSDLSSCRSMIEKLQ